MKVLIISNLFPPEFIGGYELGAFDVARHLAEQGHDIFVLTSPMVGDSLDAGVDFALCRNLQCVSLTAEFELADERRFRGGLCNIYNLKMIANALVSFQPDCVLCCNLAGLGPYPILLFLVRLGISPVVYLADRIFENVFADLEERQNFMTFFDFRNVMSNVRLLPMSELVRSEVSEILGFKVQKEFILPAWVDAHGLPDIEPRPRVDNEVMRFVFSSRIAPHKGIDVVIDACDKLRERGYDNFTVDLYGAGEVALTIQKIKLHALEKRIRFSGSLDRQTMLSRFAEFDFLLFPTWAREPFGFVAAEAAFQGCPPIMTGECGAAEWFRDEIDCIKIERTGISLAEAMIQAIDMNPAALTKLKRTAKAMARKSFDFEYWMGRIEQTLCKRTASYSIHDVADVLNTLTVQLRLWL